MRGGAGCEADGTVALRKASRGVMRLRCWQNGQEGGRGPACGQLSGFGPAATPPSQRSEVTHVDKQERQRRLLDDISAAQLLAGALAAATSLLLSTYIGIAGSVIGVAVGSVVATVSSQLYRRFLAASAEKIREIPAALPHVTRAPHAREASKQLAEDAPRAPAPGSASAPDTVSAPASASASDARGLRHRKTPTPHLADMADASLSSVRAHVDARRHEERVRRGALFVSLASALVAVLVSAGVVEALTNGEGLGAKPAASLAAPAWHSAETEAADSQFESSGENASASDGEAGFGESPDAEEGSEDSAGEGSSDEGGAPAQPDAPADGDASSSGSSTGGGSGEGGSDGSDANAGSNANDAETNGESDSA